MFNRVIIVLVVVFGMGCWLFPGKDRQPLKDVRLQAEARAKAIFDRQVAELTSPDMPKITIEVKDGDGPCSLMGCGLVPVDKYSEAVLVTAFQKLNYGVRLWPHAKVVVPDYPEFLIQQVRKDKLAKS